MIFDELTIGHVYEASRAAYISIIEDLANRGVEAVVLACTEIELLVSDSHSPIPVVDSTGTHAVAAVEAALGGQQPSPLGARAPWHRRRAWIALIVVGAAVDSCPGTIVLTFAAFGPQLAGIVMRLTCQGKQMKSAVRDC